MSHRILITGAGGPAATTLFKSVMGPEYRFYMGDMDAYAAGLYFVPEDRRVILPRGDSEQFVDFVIDYCQQHNIKALIPTVDIELVTISKKLKRFADAGICLYLSSAETLAMCFDKYELLSQCHKSGLKVGGYEIWQGQELSAEWEFPLILKDRTGSGGRDIYLIESVDELASYDKSGLFLLQEYLPGMEFSVDTYVNTKGDVIAAVPRQRLKVDSGIAVTARTIKNDSVIKYALKVAQAIPLRGVANIQVRIDRQGEPKLLEINPRFPGTMSITVAAGVNMPEIYLRELMGECVEGFRDFEEVVQVRYWEDKTVSVGALNALKE